MSTTPKFDSAPRDRTSWGWQKWQSGVRPAVTLAGTEPQTILIFEEDANSSRAYEQLSAVEGFEVLLARSASDVIGFVGAGAWEISALMLDFDAAEPIQAELLRRVRAFRPELPILYLSGLPQDHAALREALTQPLTRLAPKPVDMAAVAATLRTLANESPPREP